MNCRSDRERALYIFGWIECARAQYDANMSLSAFLSSFSLSLSLYLSFSLFLSLSLSLFLSLSLPRTIRIPRSVSPKHWWRLRALKKCCAHKIDRSRIKRSRRERKRDGEKNISFGESSRRRCSGQRRMARPRTVYL